MSSVHTLHEQTFEEIEPQTIRDTITRAQETVFLELQEALEKNEKQNKALENIEHIQLRYELLRNIMLNWEPFMRSLEKKGMDIRINQYAHIQHLISFLEKGYGTDGPLDCDISQDLMTYEVQPTGAGKTGAFAIDIALMDVPSLIQVPLDSLLEQTKKDLIKIGDIPEADIGIVGGGRKEIGRKHTIATYLGHLALMRNKNSEYAQHLKTQCKLVICDEVHYQALGTSTQSSIQAIDEELCEEEREMIASEQESISHISEETSVKSLKIGFTATPRGAKKNVDQYFPHCLGRVFHREMVEAGLVVPYTIVQCDGTILETEIEKYITEEAEVAILQRENIYHKLAEKYAEALATYKIVKENEAEMPLRGMAFCTTHAECLAFAKEAEKYNLRCNIVTGREAKGKNAQRVIDEAVHSILDDECDLLVTVEKLATGFNCEEINAVIWARITSAAKIIQGVGRGARACTDDEGRKKKDCKVFETDWIIQGKDDKKSKRRKALRLADALALNGEDPESICTMANGQILKFQALVTRDVVEENIKEKYTPKDWATMKVKGKEVLSESFQEWFGRPYGEAIATLFDIKGDPVSNHSVHLAIGRKIWRDIDAQIINAANAFHAQVVEKIKKNYTAVTWAKMNKKDKEALSESFQKWFNRPYGITVATLFGIKGDPVRNHSFHLTIGRTIWEDVDTLKEEEKLPLTKKMVEEKIKEKYTPQIWVAMKLLDKKALSESFQEWFGRPYGMAISTLFSLKGDPVGKHSIHLAIGRKIWPEAEIE